MNLKLLLCADSGSIDIRTNTLSIFHVIEEISSPAFPLALPRISIMAFFERAAGEPSRPEVRLRVTLNEQEIMSAPLAVDFQQRLKNRTIADIHGLLIPGQGTLRVEVRSGENELGRWEVSVNQVGQPQIQVQNQNPAVAQPQ